MKVVYIAHQLGAVGDFASMREAYVALAEDVAKLLDAVRLQQIDRSRGHKIRNEALDITAVALRVAERAGNDNYKP